MNGQTVYACTARTVVERLKIKYAVLRTEGDVQLVWVERADDIFMHHSFINRVTSEARVPRTCSSIGIYFVHVEGTRRDEARV